MNTSTTLLRSLTMALTGALALPALMTGPLSPVHAGSLPPVQGGSVLPLPQAPQNSVGVWVNNQLNTLPMQNFSLQPNRTVFLSDGSRSFPSGGTAVIAGTAGLNDLIQGNAGTRIWVTTAHKYRIPQFPFWGWNVHLYELYNVQWVSFDGTNIHITFTSGTGT